jgi:hypothetical protein
LKPKEVGKLDPLTCLSFYFKKKKSFYNLLSSFGKKGAQRKEMRDSFHSFAFINGCQTTKGKLKYSKFSYKSKCTQRS